MGRAGRGAAECFSTAPGNDASGAIFQCSFECARNDVMRHVEGALVTTHAGGPKGREIAAFLLCCAG
jgi:hypothetical protein